MRTSAEKVPRSLVTGRTATRMAMCSSNFTPDSFFGSFAAPDRRRTGEPTSLWAFGSSTGGGGERSLFLILGRRTSRSPRPGGLVLRLLLALQLDVLAEHVERVGGVHEHERGRRMQAV